MERLRYFLFLLILTPSVALAININVFSPVKNSTKTLSCTDASGSTAVALEVTGAQLHFYNRGTVPAFVNWGTSTVTAGTGSTVVGPGNALFTRNLESETHVACRMATGETATVYVETGYGE